MQEGATEETQDKLKLAWSAYNTACGYTTNESGYGRSRTKIHLKIASCMALMAIAEELQLLNRILNNREGSK